MIQQLYEHLKTQQDEMVETLRALVEQETPTDDKAAIDRAQTWVRAQFESVGGVSELLPQATAGDHQRITFGAGESQLSLLTHIDTVYPMGTLAQMPFRREGKLAHGPGSFDMKGGIVISLYALKALRALNLKPKR